MASANGHIPGNKNDNSSNSKNETDFEENGGEKTNDNLDGSAKSVDEKVSIDNKNNNRLEKRPNVESDDEKVPNNIVISIDEAESGKIDSEKKVDSFVRKQNGCGDSDLLGAPRNGPRMSFMEEESAKERMRLSLLKQCSAILKQGDQRYNKDTLHKTFQDEWSKLIDLYIFAMVVMNAANVTIAIVNTLTILPLEFNCDIKEASSDILPFHKWNRLEALIIMWVDTGLGVLVSLYFIIVMNTLGIQDILKALNCEFVLDPM